MWYCKVIVKWHFSVIVSLVQVVWKIEHALWLVKNPLQHNSKCRGESGIQFKHIRMWLVIKVKYHSSVNLNSAGCNIFSVYMHLITTKLNQQEGKQNEAMSEWVSSFLMAHQHSIGYAVPKWSYEAEPSQRSCNTLTTLNCQKLYLCILCCSYAVFFCFSIQCCKCGLPLESVTSNQKSDCQLMRNYLKNIPPNFILIRFEMTEPFLKRLSQQKQQEQEQDE